MILEYGPLTIDLIKIKAYCEDHVGFHRPYHLPITSLRMLTALIHKSEQVLTFAELGALYEAHNEQDRVRVATRMSRVRREIKIITGKNMIWSCTSYGYFICDDEDKADQICADYKG